MPQIKKILFPVDFSDACRGAARYVEAFAARFEAEIMLLHAAGKREQQQAKAQLDAFLASELRSFTTHRRSRRVGYNVVAVITLRLPLQQTDPTLQWPGIVEWGRIL